MKTRIYIVDDELMAIQYFKYLLEETKIEYEVIGEATNGVKAIPEILRLHPDIVFADISMPVMDGLQMAEEILKTNVNQKIVILTSYRDFDYAKRGMNIGVTDYVLKNEFSEDSLKILITKIMKELVKEKKAQHFIVEHNTKKFLLSDSKDMEDHIYEQKPFQRYALISIVKKPKVSLQLTGPLEHIQVDCYEIENLNYPQGITCRAVIEMASLEWCGVFFIDGNIPDSTDVLVETAEMLRGVFAQYCKDCIYFISRPTNRFIKLQEVYKEQKILIGYSYTFKDEQILHAEQTLKTIGKQATIEPFIENMERQFKNDNLEEALKCVIEILELSKKSRNIWEYSGDIQNIYRHLKKYVQEKKINPETIEVKEIYMDTDQVEQALIHCLQNMIEEIKIRKQNQYSYYIVCAIDYIQKNYDKDISIPDIAESIKISEGHLRKCFKHETNKTILDYLTEYRLKRVKILMENGERRIDEIWKKTGFTSSQYFSYVFKRNEGMTPSDYMKKLNIR